MTDSPRWPALRIGEGWDTHALVVGRPLVLGGVTIPHSHGLLGHSDADALLHAITDALLGAAGLGDIGRHFPDTVGRVQGSGLVGPAGRGRAPRAGGRLGSGECGQHRRRPGAQDGAAHPGDARAHCRRAGAGAGRRQREGQDRRERMGPVGEGQAIETRAVCLLVKLA
jgi:2-C-methyl-D-erythritol 2,4-cyclodiphosphate synthase